MRVGESVHAVKFMVKIREEHFQEAVTVLTDLVIPVLKSSGFREVLILVRRRRLEKLDPNGPGNAGSRVLRRLAEASPPHEADLDYARRELPSLLGGDMPTGFAHGIMLHQLKTKDPAEYRRRREGRIAEQRRLTEQLLSEENWSRVAGYQLDCYAIYGSEADMKADTLDLENRKIIVPHSAAFVAGEIDHLLFVKLTGIQHTVVHRVLPGGRTGALFAAQTQVPVVQRRTEEAWMRMQRSLIPGLSSREGFAGALVLRSRGEGFSGDSAWAPRSLPEHRGDPPRPYDKGGRSLGDHATVPHEAVTLWETEAALLAGVEHMEGSVPKALGDSLPSRLAGMDDFSSPFMAETGAHTERGELVLWAPCGHEV